MNQTDEMVSLDVHKNIVDSADKACEREWRERYQVVENDLIRHKGRCEQLEKDVSDLIGLLLLGRMVK